MEFCSKHTKNDKNQKIDRQVVPNVLQRWKNIFSDHTNVCFDFYKNFYNTHHSRVKKTSCVKPALLIYHSKKTQKMYLSIFLIKMDRCDDARWMHFLIFFFRPFLNKVLEGLSIWKKKQKNLFIFKFNNNILSLVFFFFFLLSLLSENEKKFWKLQFFFCFKWAKKTYFLWGTDLQKKKSYSSFFFLLQKK